MTHSHDDDLPVYRIAVEIRRFESRPGSHVPIDAIWSVRRAHGHQTLTCRSVIRENFSGGNDALVGCHRRALEEIASEIVAGIRSVAAKQGAEIRVAPRAIALSNEALRTLGTYGEERRLHAKSTIDFIIFTGRPVMSCSQIAYCSS
ncbi:membrane integrity-associated transporter subunit PqiC [Burkholderia sp. MS455]|nr:membrane integrity-associated transporter subunit PqiC [Burkholderia sp. MS455]